MGQAGAESGATSGPFVRSWAFYGVILGTVIVAEALVAAGGAGGGSHDAVNPEASDAAEAGAEAAGDDDELSWDDIDFESEAPTAIEDDLADSARTHRVLRLLPALFLLLGLFWRPDRGRWLWGLGTALAAGGMVAGFAIAGVEPQFTDVLVVALTALGSFYAGALAQSLWVRVANRR